MWVSTSIKRFQLEIADQVWINSRRASSTQWCLPVVPSPALVSPRPCVWLDSSITALTIQVNFLFDHVQEWNPEEWTLKQVYGTNTGKWRECNSNFFSLRWGSDFLKRKANDQDLQLADMEEERETCTDLFGMGAMNARIAGRWWRTPAKNSCPILDMPCAPPGPLAMNTLLAPCQILRWTCEPLPAAAELYLPRAHMGFETNASESNNIYHK